MFAFHVEETPGYIEIQRTFTEDEKCNVASIRYLTSPYLYIGVSLRSQVREQIRIGYAAMCFETFAPHEGRTSTEPQTSEWPLRTVHRLPWSLTALQRLLSPPWALKCWVCVSKRRTNSNIRACARHSNMHRTIHQLHSGEFVQRVLFAVLESRSANRVLEKKPKCGAGLAVFSAVQLRDVAPALHITLTGYAFAVSLLLIEKLIWANRGHDRKESNHFHTTVASGRPRRTHTANEFIFICYYQLKLLVNAASPALNDGIHTEARRATFAITAAVARAPGPRIVPDKVRGGRRRRETRPTTAKICDSSFGALFRAGQGGAKIHYEQSVRPDARGVSDSRGLKTPEALRRLPLARTLFRLHLSGQKALESANGAKRSVSGVRKLRERSPGAETVCGLGVQTAGSPGRTPVANSRRATYTARHPTYSYTRGARHYGTRLEGTLTRNNTLN
ncbi:hypothetical protein EVAR_20331_1 [Eumeta japonica]|uniref:Uncharacterized protein n=1 Tax=Eumeta variegata TaxID=151549 RepID=A0A4C1VQW6_EUMVA|nr:hypothetical protein EVAR_20331_1 [Eumeta japonica]